MGRRMGFFSRILKRNERKADDRFGALEDMWADAWSARPTTAGPTVSWESALQVSTALRCVAVICDGIATVPFKLYRESDGRRSAARDMRLYDVMATAPNEWQTSLEFRETMGMHLALAGNFYAFKNRVRGEVVELLPLEPRRVSVEQKSDWGVEYTVTGANGEVLKVGQDDIWHVRGRSWNGYVGLEPLKLAREALGLAIAAERTQGTIHGSGVRPGGVLSVEGNLTEDQFKFYRKWIEANAGALNAGRPLVLDRAVKWQQMALSSVDGQHLETRRFQVEEICAHFGIMPIMVGFSDKAATYASAEQMFLAHQVHGIRPWHRRIEQSADRHLLRAIDRKAGLYFGFVDTEMLRGAAKDRAEYYSKMVLAGIMTRNEVRGFEEMDEIPGLERGILPANYSVLDEKGVPVPPPAPEKSPESAQTEQESRESLSQALAGVAKAVAESKSASVVVEAPTINVSPPAVHVTTPEITVNTPEVKVDVQPANFTTGEVKIDVHAHMPKRGAVEKTVTRYDEKNRILSMRETEIEEGEA